MRRKPQRRSKSPGTKKRDEKALIPLPPTGFTSFFCANVDGVTTRTAAQARCGVARVNGYFTTCKAVQRNAARLQNDLE